MRLKESIEEGVEVLTLEGEIDLHYAPVLRALLMGKIKSRCPALILNMGGVSFIDSTGLAAIIEYFRDSSAFEGVLCLTGLNATLKSILEIVRLDQLIAVFQSPGAAITALKQGEVKAPAAALFHRPAA